MDEDIRYHQFVIERLREDIEFLKGNRVRKEDRRGKINGIDVVAIQLCRYFST